MPTRLVEKALQTRGFGPYSVQAAVAAVHAEASSAAAMRDGPAAGWALLERINKEGERNDYQWLYAAQADLYRRLGQVQEARAAYQKALSMSQQGPERRFLRRLREL
jgi:RNA polymerase sigma-70 factor (ECF subfamily)